MSIPVLPRPYETCSPEEKLQRLRVSYANARISLAELERLTTEALVEQQFYDRKDAGLLSDAEREAYDKHIDAIFAAGRTRDGADPFELRRRWIARLVAEAT